MKEMNFGYIGKDKVFICSLSENVSLKGNVNYPKWNSWQGLFGWVKEGIEKTGFPASLVELGMRSPKEDFSWLLEVPEETRRELLHFSPFSMDLSLREKKKWYTEFKNMCTWKTYVWGKNKRIFSTIAEYKAIGLARRITDDTLTPLQITELIPNWLSMKPKEVRRELLDGFEVLDRNFGTVFDIRKYLPSMNLEFWDNGNSIRSLLKAGVKPEAFIPSYLGGITNKEIPKVVNLLKDSYLPYILEWKREWIGAMRDVRYPNLPNHFLPHINSLAVMDWAARHIDQLSRVKTVYGPAGAVATVYYHQLMEYIIPEMLTNGPKTSWKKVYKEIEQIAKNKINDQLGTDRPLPKFPEKIKDKRIVQITTTHQLRDEGIRMNHCVGGYVNACDELKSYIFHVDDGSQLGATIEICPSGKSYIVQQSKANNNREALDANDIAIKWLATIKERR